MRVFLSPSIALHSRAMVRIANALTIYAPSSISITNDISSADIVIFYPISHEWFKLIDQCVDRGQRYALVQCCSGKEGANWQHYWFNAVVVWSYLDLNFDGYDKSSLYYCPLGVDAYLSTSNKSNRDPNPSVDRDIVLTTGYTHGYPAEAILEPWIAANAAGLKAYHIGGWPREIPRDISLSLPVTRVEGIGDDQLALLYRRAKYVCSLRYRDGFELPAAEGLCCGARPILFDQPDLRQWYGNHAVYLPEIEGDELVDRLEGIFRSDGHGDRVSEEEKEEAVKLFDWKPIVEGFWKEVLR